tara:strand:+ start:3203 stop:4129 length:927 start_codon:yes stop_codon:yes gene_type:complete
MKATRDAFGDQLVSSGRDNKDIIALSADLGKATKINKFADAYPDRFFEIGIAENNMIGVASGLSDHGYKVFLASFASFLTGKYDTIRCSLSYSNAPCVVVGTHGGLAIGKDGVTQMGLEDMSLMRSLPDMCVINPSTYNQTKSFVRHLCENNLECVNYLRLGRQPVAEFYDDEFEFEFGRGVVCKDKENPDAVVYTTGCVLSDVLNATEGLNVTVIDMPFIKPIDKEIILNNRSELVFTVEDHSIIGGLGSSVSEVITDHGLNSRLCRIGVNDTFPESGSPADLYVKYGLDSNSIRERLVNEMDKQRD